MPFYDETTRQKNFIQNKFQNIAVETERVIELFRRWLHIFSCKLNDLILNDGHNFFSLYQKLNNDFEDFQKTLFYITTTLRLPLDSYQISYEVPGTDTADICPSIYSGHSCECQFIKEQHKSNSSSLRYQENPFITNIGASMPESELSSSSSSYRSICDIGTSKAVHDLPAINTAFSDLNQDNFLRASQALEHVNQDPVNEKMYLGQSFEDVLSIESVSQSSCYRSLSSNISDLGYQYTACSNGNSVKHQDFNSLSFKNSKQNESHSHHQKIQIEKVISPPDITVPMTLSATLTHIENPGNFWMQLENSESSLLNFPMEKFLKGESLCCVKEGDFCLAPSKSVPFYSRVKVLSKPHSEDMELTVLFIDHGSTRNVKLHELRVMPEEAYDVPMQAIHCFLAEVSAPNNIWCYAAIQKMKEFSNNAIDTYIKTQNDDMFGVQLIAITYMFDEEFPCDIGEALCYDNFAIPNKESLESTDNNLNSILSDDTRINSHQISCDSGVSVTSNMKSNPSCQQILCSSEALNTREFYSAPQEVKKDFNFQHNGFFENDPNYVVADLISFESVENLCNESEENERDVNELMINQCFKICTCSCPLHLLIPFPSISYVEENMVLVMMSHIVNPNEFYVNMAMESSTTLDELLEQMTLVYNSATSPGVNSIVLDDLKEGMFCAALFEDGNWYRVKVLDIHLKFDQSPNVYVQYVDYGNKAWIRNTDLRTLTPEFAKSPSYSVKCSLAGIVPVDSFYSNKPTWSESALNIFKNMLDFEHCLTAQVCGRTTIFNDDPLQVLLWDTQKAQDVLINKAFADSGMAEFDLKIIEDLFIQQEKKCDDVEILHCWDPMTYEYNDVQNSYGVPIEDFQVAVTGYKQKDENYTCKYYSLRGYCPRSNCPYKHVSLAEGGVTRDQEEVYAFNTSPLLPKCEEFVLVTVSSILTPSHFYMQLPFGVRNVDEIDSLVNEGFDEHSLINQEVKALYQALNNQYNNLPFDEKTTVDLAYGNIIVAQRQFDQAWHRARVIDLHEINGQAKVFYVDFGNEEWVDRRKIRGIRPEFLHLPFQAVECCLYDVEPLGFEHGRKWSASAVSLFEKLVYNTTMLAYVADKCNDILHVSLRRTTESDHNTVSEHLIREGFAQHMSCTAKKYQDCKYIPG